eukprot:g80172.t1
MNTRYYGDILVDKSGPESVGIEHLLVQLHSILAGSVKYQSAHKIEAVKLNIRQSWGRLGKSNNASATMLTATNSSVSMVKPPAEDSATAAGVRVGRPSDAPPAVPAHLLAEAAAAAKLASREQPATDDASAAA